MAYKITNYTKQQAKIHGVSVNPSSAKGKRIDVLEGVKKVASVGALGMNDYPTSKAKERSGEVEKGTAEERRKLYKIRHKKDRSIKGTKGYYADKLLW